MQIENIKQLGLFLQTICQAADSQPIHFPSVERRESAPMVTEDVCSLTELLDEQDCIMSQLTEKYESDDLSDLASATRKISRMLKDESLFSSSNNSIPSRLVDYVYPVV